jgi:hypothetical protein
MSGFLLLCISVNKCSESLQRLVRSVWAFFNDAEKRDCFFRAQAGAWVAPGEGTHG